MKLGETMVRGRSRSGSSHGSCRASIRIRLKLGQALLDLVGRLGRRLGNRLLCVVVGGGNDSHFNAGYRRKDCGFGFD